MSEDNEKSALLFGFPGDLQAGGIAVCECESEDEAEFCSFVLNEAGIQNAPLRREKKLDLRWPQF
jgi:hypothetical protein